MRFDDRHEVVVTGPWDAEMAQAVESGVADRVVLNHALGYDEPDLSFLAHLPVRELVVLDRRIVDLTPVYTLAPTLERLDVEVHPSVRIDLTRLPHLRDLGATWVQVEATLGAVAELRRVHLDAYEPDDLAPLSGLRRLESVRMKERPRLRSLTGLGELTLLTHLGIYLASRLEDVTDLRDRRSLRNLHLNACRRLGSLADLAGCTGLRTLDVAEGADLDSAAPLAGLDALEELYAYGSTRFVDGDLSPIGELPRLVELRMQSRRHYRPGVPELRDVVARRAAG